MVSFFLKKVEGIYVGKAQLYEKKVSGTIYVEK